MSPRPVARPVVTFDKGNRVARLEPGATLDGRQVGILLSRMGTDGCTAKLVHWDATHDPGATKRMEGLLATKGPDAKTTLLLALSMSVLRKFTFHDGADHVDVELEGDRAAGYAVVRVTPAPKGE